MKTFQFFNQLIRAFSVTEFSKEQKLSTSSLPQTLFTEFALLLQICSETTFKDGRILP